MTIESSSHEGYIASSGELPPANIVDIDFLASLSAIDIPIAAHVDSIQAILLTCAENPLPGLKILGRDLSDPAMVERLKVDPLYNLFTRLRVNARDMSIRLLAKSNIKVPDRYGVETGDGPDFPTTFYDLSEMVNEFTGGNLNVTGLLPVFGGTTHLVLGSDISTAAELEIMGGKIRDAVWDRQYGAPIVSVLVELVSKFPSPRRCRLPDRSD